MSAEQGVILWQFLLILVAAAITALSVYTLLSRWHLPSRGPARAPSPLPETLLYLLLVTYALTFSALSLMRHDALKTGGFDLGVYDQVIWNTSQGRLFETSLAKIPGTERATNYLGFHFSPILALIAPIYWIYADARVLLVLQSIALALGALPIYWLARERWESRWGALLIALVYLLFPGLESLNLFDFHGIALAVPLLSFATYFLLKRSYTPFLLFLSLSLLTREDIAVIAVAFGLFIFLGQQRRWLGAMVTLLGLGWGYLTFEVLVPYFQGGEYPYLSRYSYLGGSPGEILRTLLSSPGYVLGHLLTPERPIFLLRLLVPLGMLPLLAPEILFFALPTLVYLLISEYEPEFLGQNQYPAPIIAFLFFAAIVALKRGAWRQGMRRAPLLYALASYLLVASLLSYYLHGPGPLSLGFSLDRYRLTPRTALGQELMTRIPPEASLSTTNFLAPHLSRREDLYLFPALRQAEYVLLDTQTFAHPEANLPEQVEALEDLRTNRLYQLLLEEDSYLLLRREQSPALPHTTTLSFEGKMILLGYELEREALASGESLRVGLYWRSPQAAARPEERQRYTAFLHLLDGRGRLIAQRDQEPQDWVWGTDHWSPEELVYQRYLLEVPLGTPPGEYTLKAGVYPSGGGDDLEIEGQNPPQTRFVLGKVRVTRARHYEVTGPLPVRQRLEITLKNEVELLGHDFASVTTSPGETLQVPLLWLAKRKPQGDYLIRLRLLDAGGRSYGESLSRPVAGTYPTPQWEAGEMVRDIQELRVAANAPPGRYRLMLSLDGSPEVQLAEVEVKGRERRFALPPISHPLEARLGESIRLRGYDMGAIKANEVPLTLYWQAGGGVEKSYTVFTHLIDSEGRIWGQEDAPPQRGGAPTSSWLKDEVIVDEYAIPIRADAPPGEYWIEVGMYDARTGERLSYAEGGDRILLGPLVISR